MTLGSAARTAAAALSVVLILPAVVLGVIFGTKQVTKHTLMIFHSNKSYKILNGTQLIITL